MSYQGTTPFAQTIDAGVYQVSVPASVTDGPNIYNFIRWEDGSTNPVRQVTLNQNLSLMATYVLQTYTLAIETATGGITSPAAGTYTYNSGTSIDVEAIANARYSFAEWTLDGASAGIINPLSVLMNADHVLKPIFAVVTHKLTIGSSINKPYFTLRKVS